MDAKDLVSKMKSNMPKGSSAGLSVSATTAKKQMNASNKEQQTQGDVQGNTDALMGMLEADNPKGE